MKHLFKTHRSLLLIVFFILCNASIEAQIKMPAFFSDGMVLQRNAPIAVWGWALPGEKVTIHFKNKTYTTVADTEGKWKTNLAKSKAGGPYDLMLTATNTISIKNVLIGDVWICSGQSNMEYKVTTSKALYETEIASSANDHIRQFAVDKKFSFAPLNAVTSTGWKAADPQNVLSFSAVAYFFARELYEKYKVPIGLIHTSWGGTVAQAWTSKDGLTFFPQYLQRIEYAANPDTLKKLMSPAKPALQNEPTVLYNAMIAPLIPYTIKGAIWYQGESNAGKAYEYRSLFPALINDWRSHWGQGDFPFLFVQLANFMAPVAQPAESNWAELREAQLLTLSVPKTGMAVIHDIGEEKDIHPKNKKDVGVRLALAAEKVALNEKRVVYSGPVYQSMKVKDNKIILKCTNAGSGLWSKGADTLTHFAIAGDDRKFVWAHTKIEGDKIKVWNDDIPHPVAVRYAWANNAVGANLYNKEGLPATAFRTDDWMITTKPK